MIVSSPFNRLYHSMLNEAFYKAGHLIFHDWIDTTTGKPFILINGIDYSDMDELKQIFKIMNLDYPMDDNSKTSTTKVDNRILVRHLDWIKKILNINGIELQIDIDEYERIKREAGIS